MHQLPERALPPALGEPLRVEEVHAPSSWPLLLAGGMGPFALGIGTALVGRTAAGAILGGLFVTLGLAFWIVAFLVRAQATRTSLCEGGIRHESFRAGRIERELVARWDEIETVAHRATDRFRGRRYVGSRAAIGLRTSGPTASTIRRTLHYRRDALPAELSLWIEIERRWLARQVGPRRA